MPTFMKQLMLLVISTAFAGQFTLAQGNSTASNKPHPPTPNKVVWEIVEGEGIPLCEDLLKEFKKYEKFDREKNDRCSANVIENYPYFSSPLDWGAFLDVKAYRDLFIELRKTSTLGRWYYFNGNEGNSLPVKDPEKYIARAIASADRMIRNGVQLQLLRMPLFGQLTEFEDNPETIGGLNILRISFPYEKDNKGEACTGFPPAKENRATLKLVNEAPTGPDHRLNPKYPKFWPSFSKFDNGTSHLYMYKGTMLSIRALGERIEIYPLYNEYVKGAEEKEDIANCRIYITEILN